MKKHVTPIMSELHISKLIFEKLSSIVVLPFDGFQWAKAWYLIYLIESKSSPRTLSDGFVRLTSTLLKRYVWNYQKYFSFFEELGIIIIDQTCFEGRSKGYRISPFFASHELVRVEIIDAKITDNYRRHIVDSRAVRKYPWVPKTIKQLVVNCEVFSFLQIDRDRKVSGESKLEMKHIRSKSQPWAFDVVAKDPEAQLQHSLKQIAYLSEKSVFLKLDKNGRLHHNLTNCQSSIRNFIRHREGLLGCVDIANCQPFLFSQVANETFWIKGAQAVTFYDLSKDIRERYLLSGLLSSNIIKCVNLRALLSELAGSDELMEFQAQTQMGKFYDMLQAKLLLGGHIHTRQEVKDITWEILYSSPAARKKGKRVFRAAYPLIAQLAATLQIGNDKALPSLLQALESKIMLGNVMTSINRERPELPLISIHDSIVTLVADIPYVEAIISREFINAFGNAPTVTSKVWAPENASFKDGVNYYQYLQRSHEESLSGKP